MLHLEPSLREFPRARAVPRILLSKLQGLEVQTKSLAMSREKSQRGYQLIVLSMRHLPFLILMLSFDGVEGYYA